MTGVQRIAAERRRQIKEEGYKAENDDQWDENELAMAALCYVLPNFCRFSLFLGRYWPWQREWWKPTPNNRIRELEKAGALIAAEIDRLQRRQRR
jgi:hypothetical protein